MLHQNLFPDDKYVWRGVVLLDGEFGVKLLKFTLFTYAGIACIYWFVRFVDWEHDTQIKLSEIWTYEGNLIATDILFFFVVGRLWKQRGVDHFQWLCWVVAANFYSSYITNFSMFQHSFTLYEMHCRWPLQLWVFFVCVILLVAALAVLHVIKAYQQNILVQKSLEMILCVFFLLGPFLGSPYFHLHHWYAGWIVGMHLNFNVWWSRAAMAWCWGCYINGIAVYGRDPVLTCGYAFFLSQDQHCPFLNCYLKALMDPDHHTGHKNDTQAPMVPPDWRNCSSAYHP
jgi:hypothetical protein